MYEFNGWYRWFELIKGLTSFIMQVMKVWINEDCNRRGFREINYVLFLMYFFYDKE